tara:strand:+ start:2979 stop:3581 length:603 start_codon:yes stop_codon:yes gene_type:complete
MQSKVNVCADDMGNVIIQSKNNSEYGYVRLQQDRVTFGNNGWVKKSNVSTLLLGKLEDLQSLNFKSGDVIAGKIVIKEQLEPFNSNDPDRDYKYAGDTGIICCVDGQPIYRKAMFTADVTAQDVLLAHTNGQDIKDANGTATVSKIKKGTTLEAFGIEETDNTQDDGTPPLDEVEEVTENEEVTDEVEELVEEEAETFEL